VRRFPVIYILLPLAIACSGAKVKVTGDPAGPSFKYEEAMNELLSGDYTQAATMFEDLSASTLNPVLSQMATLRLGDSIFFQARYAEAAEVYRQFIEQYARSPDWPHAAYMRGLCFLRKMPEDHWILPPAESREMSDADNAYQSFVSLIEGAPDSYYAMRARLLLAMTVERRCRHHLYVAAWYEKKNRPLGVTQRIEQAIADEAGEKARGRIPASFHCADAPRTLVRLARAYAASGNGAGVQKTVALFHEQTKAMKVSESALKEIRTLAKKYEPKEK
jgi:outer membrane protein assembly factor BamD